MGGVRRGSSHRVFVPEQSGDVFCSNIKNKTHHHLCFFFSQLLLTLYSCGNVIVLVRAFIDNRLMMILVAVYVYLKINAMKSPWS